MCALDGGGEPHLGRLFQGLVQGLARWALAITRCAAGLPSPENVSTFASVPNLPCGFEHQNG